jgi:putative heme iron utilization protein
MDDQSQQLLAELIRMQPTAALGTLRQGAPFVSMVLYAVEPDFSAFYLHISRLAHHTRDIEADNRISLMIAQSPAAEQDPQTLARLSLQGEAKRMARGTSEYNRGEALYLARHPQARPTFMLADFDLYRIVPQRARYVAGFGRIFNLNAEAIRRASSSAPPA